MEAAWDYRANCGNTEACWKAQKDLPRTYYVLATWAEGFAHIISGIYSHARELFSLQVKKLRSR
jgi:hypothetical protein